MEKKDNMIDFNFISQKKDNKNIAKKNIYRYNRYNIEYYMQIMEYLFHYL